MTTEAYEKAKRQATITFANKAIIDSITEYGSSHRLIEMITTDEGVNICLQIPPNLLALNGPNFINVRVTAE